MPFDFTKLLYTIIRTLKESSANYRYAGCFYADQDWDSKKKMRNDNDVSGNQKE